MSRVGTGERKRMGERERENGGREVLTSLLTNNFRLVKVFFSVTTASTVK